MNKLGQKKVINIIPDVAVVKLSISAIHIAPVIASKKGALVPRPPGGKHSTYTVP